MAKDTNGGNKAIKIIGLVLVALAMLGTASLAWTTLNSRVACVETRQEVDQTALDKFERRMVIRLDRMDEKLDALILHAEIRVPK